MACDVLVQPTAQRELESIVSYLVSLDAGAAKNFLDAWDAMLLDLREGVVEHRLSRFSLLARLGYRTVLVKGYVVLYVKKNDVVDIMHVFHQSQDYRSLVM